MRRVLCATVTAGLLSVLSSAAAAQWIRHPTPNIPRVPVGKPNLAAPAPRSADGRPDLSGLWRAASRNLILDITQGSIDGPVVMRPAAEALYAQRTSNVQRDDPSARCVPGGVPRSNLVAAFYPMRIVPAPGRLFILYEAIHGYREIFADGRALPPSMNPTWMGYSIGAWQADEFVVTTAGFNNDGWLDNAGHPVSERLRVTERFRRVDFGHIDLRITIDDPLMYAKPWTFSLPLTFQADDDLLEYICSENNRYFEIIPKR